MTITLRPDQEAWLKQRVALGDFPSVEAAARTLLDERIAELSPDAPDDMAWAKPLVDEARSAVERGDVVSFEDYRAQTSALLASLKR